MKTTSIDIKGFSKTFKSYLFISSLDVSVFGRNNEVKDELRANLSSAITMKKNVLTMAPA